jgi:hypothetical protein
MTVYDFQPPPARIVQLAALRTAFPEYVFNVIRGDGAPRYEAVSRDGGDPYCLISTDAREIWRELRQSVSVAEGVTVRAWR